MYKDIVVFDLDGTLALRDIYKKAKENNDYGSAIKAVMEIYRISSKL